jgi:divalent metal cation (Fe/Co/Zn/Cd) transporter
MLIGTFMGAVEVGLFVVTGNRALLTDGFVNVISLIPGTLSLMSVHLGRRQADWRMHYGYRRVETLMVLLFALAVCGFATKQVADTLLYPAESLVPEYGTVIAGYAVAAIIIEILLSRHLWRVGKETDSRLLLLDAVLLRGDIVIIRDNPRGGVLFIVSPSMTLIQTAITLVVVLIIFAYGAKEAVFAAGNWSTQTLRSRRTRLSSGSSRRVRPSASSRSSGSGVSGALSRSSWPSRWTPV